MDVVINLVQFVMYADPI